MIDELLFLGSNAPATLRQEGNYYEHIPEDLSNRMPGAGLNGHDDDDSLHDDDRHDDNRNDDVERQKGDVTETNYHHHQTRINNDVMFFKSRVCRNMRMFIICLQMIDGIVNILLIDNNDDSQHGDGKTCGRIEACYQHIIQLKRCLYLIINELFQFMQDCSCIQYDDVVVDNSNDVDIDGRSNICFKTSHGADNDTISNGIQNNTIHIINQNMNASNNNSNSSSCSSHSFFINHYMMTNMICCVVDTLNTFLLNDFENIFPLYVKCLPSMLKMKSDDTRDMHDYMMSIEVYEDDLKHHLLNHIDNNICDDDSYLLFPRYEVILCLIDPLITMIEVCMEGGCGGGGDASDLSSLPSDNQTQSVAIEMLHDQYPLLLPYLRRIINRVFDYLAYHSRSHYGCHQIDRDVKPMKSSISKNVSPLSFTSDLCTLTQRIIIDRCHDSQFMLLLKLEGTEFLQKAFGVSAVEWNQLYSHCIDTRAILLHSLPYHPWNDEEEEEGEESTSANINTCTDNILQLSACIMTLLA